MQVTIKKGVPERLEDYVDVMRDSALWDHYYVPDESLLRDTLAEGLRWNGIYCRDLFRRNGRSDDL